MQKRQVSWVKSRIASLSQNQPVLHHTTLFWVHSTVYVGRESRLQWKPYKGQGFWNPYKGQGFNRGTCAFDGCFIKRVGSRLTEQQNTLCFLNSKVSGRQSRILARLLEFNFNKGSHNVTASIFTSYCTFLKPLFTGTYWTRRPC